MITKKSQLTNPEQMFHSLISLFLSYLGPGNCSTPMHVCNHVELKAQVVLSESEGMYLSRGLYNFCLLQWLLLAIDSWKYMQYGDQIVGHNQRLGRKFCTPGRVSWWFGFSSWNQCACWRLTQTLFSLDRTRLSSYVFKILESTCLQHDGTQTRLTA